MRGGGRVDAIDLGELKLHGNGRSATGSIASRR
jgi:hypothetical protein